MHNQTPGFYSCMLLFKIITIIIYFLLYFYMVLNCWNWYTENIFWKSLFLLWFLQCLQKYQPQGTLDPPMIYFISELRGLLSAKASRAPRLHGLFLAVFRTRVEDRALHLNACRYLMTRWKTPSAFSVQPQWCEARGFHPSLGRDLYQEDKKCLDEVVKLNGL